MAVNSANLFDKNWERYDDWFEKHKNSYSSELKALKKVISEGFGLEVGVGSGRFANPLDVKIGIDPSKNMLKLAKKRGIQAIQGVGEYSPFRNNIFDFVLIVVTLCFVEKPTLVLNEASRVLKKGGRLVVGEINKDSWLGKIYVAKRKKSEFYKAAIFYSSIEIIELFSNVGIKYIGSYQTLLQSPYVQEIEGEPEKGLDKGGFVVIVGVKN
jgi:ubiquinone/menaquinone biosynthesis C-methylase UbiE